MIFNLISHREERDKFISQEINHNFLTVLTIKLIDCYQNVQNHLESDPWHLQLQCSNGQGKLRHFLYIENKNNSLAVLRCTIAFSPLKTDLYLQEIQIFIFQDSN